VFKFLLELLVLFIKMKFIFIFIYYHVFLVTWLIIMVSGLGESIYWLLTSRNYK
jgi:hypothetical protein